MTRPRPLAAARRATALLPLALLLTISACDATRSGFVDLDVSTLSHDPAGLVGTWDLVSVTTPGDLAPPETFEARGETLTFRGDGTAVVVRDADRTETTWRVDPARPMTLEIGARREYFGVDGDRLHFDSRPVDGPLRTFRRR